jgi:hypothetical protein
MRATCAVLALLLAVCSAPSTTEASSATLVVRLYNTAAVPVENMQAAREAARSILNDTGLSVDFRNCGSCDGPLRPSEVVVRVIAAPAFNLALHPEAYGVTYVVRETNRGWLATVFSDRIAAAAVRAGVDPGVLLGRVIAHEVGHLLLGCGYHGGTGVMRAEWTDAELMRADRDWRFSPSEAARMNGVIDTRPF